MIIKPYKPKVFGKEYYNIKGPYQYPMFLAVVLGIKPCFDDWVQVKKYNQFVKACAKYGLVVEPDVIFISRSGDKKNIVGGENITTTFMNAKRFDKEEKQGEVHVIVSKTREKAFEAKKFGWYPVIINNRLINKPFVDHLIFGKYLGYPDCCIDFFRRFNNWRLFNHPFETFKNTPNTRGKAKGSYCCNNFLMDHAYFFIHHLPCSYRCKKTIELARKVEEKINEVEPGFVEKTIELLKKPLLVFGERNFIIFDGKLKKKGFEYILNYKDCEYFENLARPEESVDFFNLIKLGNKIEVNNNKLIVKDNNSTLKIIEKKQEWFVIDFD